MKINPKRLPLAAGMRSLALVAVLFCPLGLSAREPIKPSSSQPKAQKLIDLAWAALDQKVGLKEIDQAIQSLEQALALDPGNDTVLVELANEYYHRGSLMPASSEQEIAARNVYFQKGYSHAEQALARRESAGAHAWTAVNFSCLKQHTNFMSQAAILPEMKRHVGWIEEHDPGYRYGFVARFWSGFLIQAPDMIVKMLGKDPEEVFENLQRAIAAEPGYFENYLLLADLYYSMQRKDEALDTLRKILLMSPEVLPSERAQNRYAQTKAHDRWKAWTDKEYPAR